MLILKKAQAISSEAEKHGTCELFAPREKRIKGQGEK
jgi:hypothetical protein